MLFYLTISCFKIPEMTKKYRKRMQNGPEDEKLLDLHLTNGGLEFLDETPAPLTVLSYNQKQIEFCVLSTLFRMFAAILAKMPPSNFYPKCI